VIRILEHFSGIEIFFCVTLPLKERSFINLERKEDSYKRKLRVVDIRESGEVKKDR